MRVNGQLHAPAALPSTEKPPGHIGWEDRLVLEPVSTLYEKNPLNASAGNRNPGVQSVA